MTIDSPSPSERAAASSPALRKRRGSVISLASHLDKDALTQTLDDIHHSASNSDALTTFNDFTNPPTAALGTDKGLAADIHGGLTGLYSRLRASVGGSKDGSQASPTPDDAPSNASERSALLTPSSSIKTGLKHTPLVSPAVSFRSTKPLSSAAASSADVVTATDSTAPVQPEKAQDALQFTSDHPARLPEHTKPPAIVATNTKSGPDSPALSPVTAEERPKSSVEGRKSAQSPELSKTSADAGPDHAGSRAEKAILSSQHAQERLKLQERLGSESSTAELMRTQTSKQGGPVLEAPDFDGPHHLSSPDAVADPGPSPGTVRPPMALSMSSQGQQEDLSSTLRIPSGAPSPNSIATVEDPLSDSEKLRHVEGKHLPKVAAGPKDSKGSAHRQTRYRVLSRDYWMKDENAKDCFHCGDTFTTFRRKHHCRTCGQVFDAKCTSLLPGNLFAQAGSVRVCKSCESIVKGLDDSSEFSDDGSIKAGSTSSRHGSRGASEMSPVRSFSSLRTLNDARYDVPTMAIPAKRRALNDASKRQSAIVEIDAEPRLIRPSSSRSLKSGSAGRAHLSSHRRHNSRSLLSRSFRPSSVDRAPFHRSPEESPQPPSRLPAFHDDNVIDPELAPYMSDDSSGDEQFSILDRLNSDQSTRTSEPDRGPLSSYLANSKRRSRVTDKAGGSIVSTHRDLDSTSLSSAKLTSSRFRRRGVSMSSNTHLRPSPRVPRFSTASAAIPLHLHETLSSQVQEDASPNRIRMIRSCSMYGSEAPRIELNAASIQHVKRLLAQMLRDTAVGNVASWEKALMPILLQATDDVTPDVQNGDDIDVRHYVKVKKIPGGRPGDTAYISGLVFRKNLALKSMLRSIANPNILIVTFALEYARREEHFMSLEPVIRQEKEYLQNLVHRIAALKPQLLLVQRNVSGLALQYLEEANIATAYNVKPSVLEAVARCAQTRIITSIDRLAIKPAQAGRCASFYLKTYMYQGRKKTYMYLSGCPKELGCTITLRGSSLQTLAKIKRITEFMIYVVYNLKLETYFLRDEFALIPSYAPTGTIVSDELGLITQDPAAQEPGRLPPAEVARSGSADQGQPNSSPIATITQSEAITGPNLSSTSVRDDVNLPADAPLPTFHDDIIARYRDRILSASPFVKFLQPYLLVRAREQERKLGYLRSLRGEITDHEDSGKPEEKLEKFRMITPDMIHENLPNATKKVQEVIHAIQDAEYDKVLHVYQTRKKQWETYITGNPTMVDPLLHQNVVLLYSMVCTVNSVPCAGPELLAFGFYDEHENEQGFEADCTLGQYVEDLCLSAGNVCIANSCENKMTDHHRQYVHGSAQLSVAIEPYMSKLSGLQDIILMWSVCRICRQETQVTPMSDNTWKYSFGKYLELSFWCSGLRPRAGICRHDLHRDHIRYFGFKNYAVRFQYDPVNLLEIIVPRTRITWKVVNDLNFKNEMYRRVEDRLNRFMYSVKARVKSIKDDSVLPEKAEASQEEKQRLVQKAAEEHTALLRTLQEKYVSTRYFEIVPFNRAIRYLQEKVAEWDKEFADFDKDFFPSEKDISRLATLQLRKIFLDREGSTSTLASNEDDITGEKNQSQSSLGDADGSSALLPHARNMTHGEAHDILTSVVEGHAASPHDQNPGSLQDENGLQAPLQLSPESSQPAELPPEVQHLDLAVPVSTHTSEQTSPPPSRPASPERNQLDHTPSPDDAMQKTSSVDARAKLSDTNIRRSGQRTSPALNRAQSQPAHLLQDRVHHGSSTQQALSGPGSGIPKKVGQAAGMNPGTTARQPDKRLSDRLGIGALKTGIGGHSMIPRSVAARRKESKVSTLAKHFEQLSREFELERLRDRDQRAAKTSRSRAYPMAASKPILEEYRNVHEAVSEKEPPVEDLVAHEHFRGDRVGSQTAEDMALTTLEQTNGDGFHAEGTRARQSQARSSEADDRDAGRSPTDSDMDLTLRSGDEESFDGDSPGMTDSQTLLTASDSTGDLKLDLPKHEKHSLMRMLTNFWAERSASGWAPLDYPLNASDHVFADSNIIIREDEPSSLIAFALDSEDYKAKLKSINDKSANLEIRHGKPYVEDLFLTKEDQMRIERSLLQSTGTHLRYQFQEGSARMLCKIFYAEQFDAVRRKCGINSRIVETLSRCMKWDSKGGKTKSVFLKTLDDRLILKSLSQIETQAFLRFAPAYFELMGEALFHELPSVIAKMLGFYQVVIRNPVTGVDFNWYLLVMENLFYDRSPDRIFDLKGSMRNRKIQSTGEQNEVLLDENMVEFIYETPLFTREHSKRLLGASVFNDTLFLSRQNVMDYSLMVGIDEDKRELVVGIIDCIRTYTWDKKLESWMKDRGKNRPTVTSPKDYKNRFREAMGRYILQAPTCWHLLQSASGDPKRTALPGISLPLGDARADGDGE